MIRSCIINGVPLIIHTISLHNQLNGLNDDIDPKAITSPKGAAPISVTKNSLSVCKKPTLSDDITMGICSKISAISNLSNRSGRKHLKQSQYRKLSYQCISDPIIILMPDEEVYPHPAYTVISTNDHCTI